MHTDQEVLAELRVFYDQDQLAAVVDRILRVPEAWAALHEPEFLDAVTSANPPADLTASHLASMALGGNLHSRLNAGLVDSHVDRTRQIWEEAAVGVVVQRDLFKAALLGVGFGEHFRSESETLLDQVTDSPSTWRSPIALTWLDLPEPDRLLRALLDRDLVHLAIHIAMANLPAGEAATFLTRNANGSTAKMLQEITRVGEYGLARSLSLPDGGGQDSLSQLLIEAVSERFNGEHSSARVVLHQAWDTASESAARVADFTADQAIDAGDQVTALEASRKALEILPTPLRRARTALSLIDLDRPGEALSLVSGPEPSVEELIAGGLAQAQSSDSGEMLISALASADENLDEDWCALLVSGLVAADRWSSALEAAVMRATYFPSSAEARFTLAHVLLEAGDAETAAEHGAVGLTLDPRSETGLRLQATIQRQLGNHAKALELSRELPTIENTDLAERAIAAGELELAEQLLVEMDPGPQKMVLEGKLLGYSGDIEQARAKFNAAIRKSPSEIAGYKELAATQADGAVRYNTLTEAVQANPKDPSARMLLARHLRSEGKLGEAVDVAAIAWEMDKKSVSTSLVYADLLNQLGHIDRSLEILRQAAMRQPLSWQVGLALAKAYEKRGDLAQAAQAVRPIPNTADPEAYFDVARIELKAERDSEAALEYLALSKNRGWAEPSLDYWYGVALEREQRFEEALEQYERAHNSTDYETREQAILGSSRALLGLGQTSKALATLDEARERFPRSAPILAAMSDVYLAAKLPEKAQEAAERAVELDPEETRAWQVLGDSLANTGDFRGAVAAIERLSTLDPEATDGWITLAGLASKAKDQKLVRRSIAEALWRGRRDPRSLQAAAHFLEQGGNNLSAVRAMKAAIRARPNDPQLLTGLAKFQEAAGDLRGAYDSWQACLAFNPSEPEPLRRSAVCAQLLGKGSQSVKLLEKAVAIEPGNPWLRRDLAKAHLYQGDVRQGLLAYAGATKTAPNDSSLAFEAAETALCAGDPRYALALLSKMDSAVADSGRAHAAMGEAFLLLDKREQAIASLTEAVNQEYETVRTLGMLTLIAVDRGRALGNLEKARSAPVETAHDAIWLARAELALLNGFEALEALAGWEKDAFAAREQARVALRTRDMLWLFGMSDAVSSLQEGALTEIATNMHADLQARNLRTSEIDAWLRVEGSSDELGEFVDLDPMGWIGEAVAISCLKDDQLTAASEAIDRLKLVRSVSEWSHILEGMIAEGDGRSEDARAAYRAGSSSSPIASYLLGRAYKRSGSLERAATHIGSAVIEATDQHRWQHKLASIYLAMGDEDSALAHFQQAVARDSQNPEYLLSLAEAYEASGHLNQALEGYTAALAYSSESAKAYQSAGSIALRLGAEEQASTWFERAITLSPRDVESLVGSAKAAIVRGDKHLANERLRLAMQQAPDDARVLLGVGYVRDASGDYPAALSAFEEALEAGADPSDVRRGESQVLAHQGKHTQAADAMQQVLELAPDDHRLWHELAETFEAGAALSEAERAICEAIRISPANPEYHLSLARISRKSGNLDRAIEELRKAEGIDAEDPRIPIEGGLVYEDRRDFTRALDSYLKAAELDSDSLQAHYRAGLLLRTLKAYRRAGEMLKRAAELAPANQEVMHQLAAVRALELVHG